MAEKIGNEMQTQGIKMKRPAIPTKVCIDFLATTVS